MRCTEQLVPGPFLLFAALALPACEGQVAGERASGSGGAVTVPSAVGRSGAGVGGSGTGSAEPSPVAADKSSGLRRLTRIEYANTVRSLLRATVVRRAQPKETLVDGHSSIASAQKTGYEDTEAYYELGLAAARESAPTLLQQLACSEASCFKTWARGFLVRAFRGTTGEASLARYLAIFDDVEAGPLLSDRFETFLTAVLSSPLFLYRQELGSGQATERTLTPHEVASRLSYLAWQDMPDQQLLDDASAGKLLEPQSRRAALNRLLADARAQQGTSGFTRDWLGLFEDALSKKNAALLTTTVASYPQLAEQSFAASLTDVFAQPNARYTDIFRVNAFYADSALAVVLGVTAAGSSLSKVALPAGERLGLLTHPLVIGAHSKEGGPSPFPIGKFIFQNLLCKQIPPPLPGIPAVDESSSVQTLREKLEDLTKNQPCASCHSQIGPPGFAFLVFDPIGGYHATDAKGRPYDTSGKLLLPSVAEPVPFANVSELSTTLAEQPDVARCIARRLFRFSQGRFETAEDRAGLDALEARSVSSGAQVSELLLSLVESEAFSMNRVVP